MNEMTWCHHFYHLSFTKPCLSFCHVFPPGGSCRLQIPRVGYLSLLGTMAASREFYRFLRLLSLKAANLTVPSVTAESQHMETGSSCPALVLPAG